MERREQQRWTRELPMAAIQPLPSCAWIAPSRGTPCATTAAYTVLLLTAAGAPLRVEACAVHLGPLIKRSLADPMIARASVVQGELVEPQSHLAAVTR
jgi:hypothetical protein